MLMQRELRLDGRWAEGCRNAALLWREWVAVGFSGRPGIVRTWVKSRRKVEPRAKAKQNATGVLVANCPLAWLLMADADTFPKTVAKQLNALPRHKTSESLTNILDAAIPRPLKDLALSLRNSYMPVCCRPLSATDSTQNAGGPDFIRR